MTTAKQSAANKANAKKSTGAKTTEGKAMVSGNAIKHGILSSRLLLAGENADMFRQLLEEMNQALGPVGILERTLVEKIAAAIWKQRRLVEAETASLELGRDMRLKQNRKQIDVALGGWGDSSNVTNDDLEEMTPDDRGQVQWCHSVIAEFQALEDDALEADDLATLEKAAPNIAGQFKREANEEGETPDDYLCLLASGGRDLGTWATELVEWCKKELERYARRPLVQSVANMVKAKLSAPIDLEVLTRYQVALDSELYKAMDALRKQQEWRIKAGVEVEAEVVG